MAGLTPLLVLEDSVLTSILGNSEIVTKFPFMKHTAARVGGAIKTGCSRCARKRTPNKSEFDGIKRAIGTMNQANKDLFKTMLKAEKVRVYYPDGMGRTIKLTF